MRKLSIIFVLLSFQLGMQKQSMAQDVNVDSVNYAFLPAIAYNSDLGLIFGGIGSRYDYQTEIRPFYSFINVSGIFSTKGLASFELMLDKPQIFGNNIRLTSNIYASKFLQATYYGLANYQKINSIPQNSPQYYEFQSFSIGLNAILRFPVFISSNKNQLDALAILNLDYETPWDNGNDRLITQEKPLGFNGGRAFMIGSGVIWEGRDSEFAPTKGSYLVTSFEISNNLWGSSYNALIFTHDMRHYLTFRLLKDITLANRVFLKHTSGETPYWKLAYAGDEQTLRGYPARRFMDDNSIIFNNELRTWLFNFSSIDTKLGGTIFMDIGRTFSNGTSLDAITDDLKFTYGLGATCSVFTPDFIIRTDIGFSEEDTGVYITIGYMF